MFPNFAAGLYSNSQSSGQSPCEHCGAVLRHEKWCITCDPAVRYAYDVVRDPNKMTVGDQLILHALGVSWVMNLCQGTCAQAAGS